MTSVKTLALLLLPMIPALGACAGAQPRVMAPGPYNVSGIGGAGNVPLGQGGLSFQRHLPTIPGPAPYYNVPQTGGAGLLPTGYGGIALHMPTQNSNGPGNYNFPDSGGAGLVPLGGDSERVTFPPIP
jgi:hypothetical protein